MNKYLGFALLLSLGVSSACSKKDNPSPPTTGGSSGNGGGATPGGTSGSGTAGTSGSSGGSGSSGSSGGDSCVNTGDINSDCPSNLPPITGSCAPHGACCYRNSNIAKVAKLGPDEPAQIEYRLNFVDIINHPLSVGLPDLKRSAQQRSDVCAGEQCLLWRFTAPRKGGQLVAGPGEVEIGIGGYNCNGTYSFYGPASAPDRAAINGEKDPGRWQSVKVPAVVDPGKQGIDRYHIPWATNRNREIARSIFMWPADWTIDWELASSGFEITDFDTSEAGEDCQGSRAKGSKWNSVAGFVAYSPLKGNDKDISKQTNQTYCSLLAFSLLPEGMKNKDCFTTPRCMPDVTSGGKCPWIKLPDSLCPENDTERAIFGCHLGAQGNVNKEEGYPADADLHCTPDKPAAALDTDMGATSKGQCCDPLGMSMTLPSCNAYRTVGKFVAAAAEITDKPISGLAPMCH
jgi:hypothetical protein